jgi:hypothetical protein
MTRRRAVSGENRVDRIRRRQFVGNRFVFLVLVLLVVTLPHAILYWTESLVEIEYEIEDAEEFLTHYRQGRSG